MELTIESLFYNVEDWARARGLLFRENTNRQFLKVAEELGELAAALAREDDEKTKDAIGDVLVTVIILSHQQGLKPRDCLQQAWDEIKGRQGKTIDGIFIKEGE